MGEKRGLKCKKPAQGGFLVSLEVAAQAGAVIANVIHRIRSDLQRYYVSS